MKGARVPEDEVEEAIESVAAAYGLSAEVSEKIVEKIAWHKVREHFDKEVRSDLGGARKELEALARSCGTVKKDLDEVLTNVYTGSHLIEAYAGSRWSRTVESSDKKKSGGSGPKAKQRETKWLTPEGSPQSQSEYEEKVDELLALRPKIDKLHLAVTELLQKAKFEQPGFPNSSPKGRPGKKHYHQLIRDLADLVSESSFPRAVIVTDLIEATIGPVEQKNIENILSRTPD